MRRLTSMSKVNDYVSAMLADGWQVLRSRKHLVLGSPDGGVILAISKTARDGSSTPRNALSLLKRKRREYESGRCYDASL